MKMKYHTQLPDVNHLVKISDQNQIMLQYVDVIDVMLEECT